MGRILENAGQGGGHKGSGRGTTTSPMTTSSVFQGSDERGTAAGTMSFPPDSEVRILYPLKPIWLDGRSVRDKAIKRGGFLSGILKRLNFTNEIGKCCERLPIGLGNLVTGLELPHGAWGGFC